MNDNDFRAVIAAVEEQLREVGVPQVADERQYVRRSADGELFLLPPREHAVELLSAFERFLAIQDRTTYDKAMRTLDANLSGNAPAGAVVVMEGREGEDQQAVDLSSAPDLYSLRGEVIELIRDIRESSDHSPTSEQ
ncbi:MAG: hypothetical protein K2P94_10695 [Rhodospirillaceae bacterium]|nr:hypothetical protein [Rhodospirillaceae bacterium]